MSTTSLVTLVFCLTIVHQVTSDAVGWSYDGAGGPTNWYRNYPDCGGVTQSPIDIQTDRVVFDRNLEHFDLSDYSVTQGVTMRLFNMGGHTAEVVYGGRRLFLRGGGLPADYVVDQFHFHWGLESRRGSEHALNGRHYPMEMHIVHHQERLGNASSASPHPNGLAVFGFFFEIGEHNHAFDTLVNNLDRVRAADMIDRSVDIPTFPLASLLPAGQIEFFRYFGSLTTPPCYESVIWSIAQETIIISEDQIAQFRTLLDHANHSLVDDFRPIQPTNRRMVVSTDSSFYVPGPGDSGTVLTSSIFAFVSGLALTLAAYHRL